LVESVSSAGVVSHAQKSDLVSETFGLLLKKRNEIKVVSASGRVGVDSERGLNPLLNSPPRLQANDALTSHAAG